MDDYSEYTCFDVGMSGRCGVECPVLITGHCENIEEIGAQAVIDFHGCEEAKAILDSYPQLIEKNEKDNEMTNTNQTQHPDDIAVDNFAAAMKAKLAEKRVQGRGGWNNKEECSKERLQGLLLEHVAKGDPVDVGNFAMMLFNRHEKTFPKQTNSQKTAKEIAQDLIESGMKCNCDLDNWQPENSTGHSWICRVHKEATTKAAAIEKANRSEKLELANQIAAAMLAERKPDGGK